MTGTGGSLHPWARPLVRAFGFDADELDPVVHPADEMFEQALVHGGGDLDTATCSYLAAGAQIARTLERSSGERAETLRLLDFGGGFGRVMRFLRSMRSSTGQPAFECWVGELIEEAVDFQRRQFDVHGFVSSELPESVRWPDQEFDVVYVGSLFTHLPEGTFQRWLEALWARVAPRGRLLFSVHDEALMPPHVKMSERGLAFAAESEAHGIDTSVHGSTWVRPGYVEQAIDRLGADNWSRFPRALCSYQDLYAVSRSPDGNVARLGAVVGQLDQAELVGSAADGGALRIEGWVLEAARMQRGRAGSMSHGQTVTVRVSLHDRESGEEVAAGEGRPSESRSDLSALCAELGFASEGLSIEAGFSVELGLPTAFSRGADLLLLTAHAGESGVPQVLFAGSVDRLLYLVRDEQYRRRRDRVFELAETIEQVKASRFWRARGSWFRLKRSLGWTEEAPDGPLLQATDRRPSED